LIRRDPIGIIASIGPWKLPVDDDGLETGAKPKSGGGNTVVVQPFRTDSSNGTEIPQEILADILPEASSMWFTVVEKA